MNQTKIKIIFAFVVLGLIFDIIFLITNINIFEIIGNIILSSVIIYSFYNFFKDYFLK